MGREGVGPPAVLSAPKFQADGICTGVFHAKEAAEFPRSDIRGAKRLVRRGLPGTGEGPYPAMAPLAQYLIPDQNAEIALARTAAPKSISDAAEVLVLTRNGYTTAVKGSNGFVCMVQRGWSGATDFSDFWNPKQRAPICFNAAGRQELWGADRVEDEVGAGRKVQGGDRPRGRVDAGQQGASAAGACGDVLHDVEAAVPERQRQGVAPAPDVLRFRRSGQELGSESAGVTGHRGGRPGRAHDHLHDPAEQVVGWNTGFACCAVTYA